MSRDGRKPWEIPIQYNDDRFADPAKPDIPPVHFDLPREERTAAEIDELLRRPDRAGREYECKDTTPVNYAKGPHDEEFGVDDHDFDSSADNPPLDYAQGPHDNEFGVDDDEDDENEDDDLDPLDDEPEFDEAV